MTLHEIARFVHIVGALGALDGEATRTHTTRASRTQRLVVASWATSSGSSMVFLVFDRRRSCSRPSGRRGDEADGDHFPSVDGVMHGPGGHEDRSGGFTRSGWLVPHVDEDSGRFINAVFDQADAFQLGRRTWLPMQIGTPNDPIRERR
jgi:hypothetical protein